MTILVAVTTLVQYGTRYTLQYSLGPGASVTLTDVMTGRNKVLPFDAFQAMSGERFLEVLAELSV